MRKAFRGTYSVLSDSLLDDNCDALQVFSLLVLTRKKNCKKPYFPDFIF